MQVRYLYKKKSNLTNNSFECEKYLFSNKIYVKDSIF